jgi:hypothetical protein
VEQSLQLASQPIDTQYFGKGFRRGQPISIPSGRQFDCKDRKRQTDYYKGCLIFFSANVFWVKKLKLLSFTKKVINHRIKAITHIKIKD